MHHVDQPVRSNFKRYSLNKLNEGVKFWGIVHLSEPPDYPGVKVPSCIIAKTWTALKFINERHIILLKFDCRSSARHIGSVWCELNNIDQDCNIQGSSITISLLFMFLLKKRRKKKRHPPSSPKLRLWENLWLNLTSVAFLRVTWWPLVTGLHCRWQRVRWEKQNQFI